MIGSGFMPIDLALLKRSSRVIPTHGPYAPVKSKSRRMVSIVPVVVWICGVQRCAWMCLDRLM